MRRFIIAAALLVSAASLAPAQSTDSRGEFFVGYSLLRNNFINLDEDLDEDPEGTLGELKTLNGVNVSATGYFTPRVGLTGDFSAHFKSGEFTDDVVVNTKLRTLNFLGGPQVRFTNRSRVTPFVRALAGVQTNRLSFDDTSTVSGGITGVNFSENFTDFALAIGGGLDVRLSPRAALRAFQIDYNPVFVRDRDDVFDSGEALSGKRINNVRFSIGVVFK